MLFKKFNLQLFADDDSSTSEDGKKSEQQAEEHQNETKKDEKKGEGEKKYTDADLNSIIDKKFAEWQKKKEKEVDEAKKLAEMNATEKAEYERDKLQKQLDEMMKEKSLTEMTKVARKMLSEDGINITDELLANLVSNSAENTKEAVKSFIELFKSAVNDAVKDALKGKAPKNSTGSDSITKEKIMKVKDRAERQKLIAEHMDLFEK
ncbi:hypothetical protein B5E87_07900 [Massilimicrobiota sp. An142]|uniref:DUF4355 domain-containing protein n=1 Tax=Massilimicrobiota sp. An142 TaxID=1965564 RepID=UPI000B38C478|nr:DUF4355 domain-containing protein [Massilimicrobiota sp. An142]OUQ12995.1 hypothetical protein B5E87_07900 [Massilimicrobiota sp. An142]